MYVHYLDIHNICMFACINMYYIHHTYIHAYKSYNSTNMSIYICTYKCIFNCTNT